MQEASHFLVEMVIRESQSQPWRLSFELVEGPGEAHV